MTNKINSNPTFYQRLKIFFRKKVNDVKNNWVDYLIKYVVFIGFFVILLFIDQFTKEFLFKKIDDPSSPSGFRGDTSYLYDYGFIGFRSVEHHGVTVIRNEITTEWGFGFIHFISILLVFIIIFVPLFTNNYVYILIASTMLAGDLGNFIDRIRFNNTVKDIIYSPFIEKWIGRNIGTFNFADTYIISSIFCLVFYIFVRSFLLTSREDMQEDNVINDLLVDPYIIESTKNQKRNI
ncbi:signal peptidase II [Mycoplasma tauri]|uniref:Signal peptidase II n=1 Tax=Mycoplasma tauri TaxID=547987 RepID=A0A953NCT0_9MOLU|nr:signal peptidase II [Mycoplasma tauri]MBZ4195492.1 signal peptidase II [Mycoplasma tauri]MBZ4203627.1 signal peptidase II [Mycoplasma tauri]MBZ4226700.1 signal peptidase II [Mycoplasma tauri]QSB07292.1 signal peptidase II [Mycoplasma tauri]